MERLRSRTKSLLLMKEARKSISVAEKDAAQPIDPNLAAGGLVPNPVARAKISLLPTAATVTSEPVSSIFSNVRTPTNDTLSPSPTLFGRRATSTTLSSASPGKGPQGSGAPTQSMAPGSSAEESSYTAAFAGVSKPSGKKYKEHTYSEYVGMMDEFSKRRWGGLGSVETEDTKRAREIRQRVLDYGKCVSQLNLQLVRSNQSGETLPLGGGVSPTRSHTIERKLTEEGELARLKRERALQFADNLKVGRPRATPSPTLVHHSGALELISSIPGPHATRKPPSHPPQDDALRLLQDIEARHKQDQERILAIKRQLGLLPALPSPADGGVDQQQPVNVSRGPTPLFSAGGDGSGVSNENACSRLSGPLTPVYSAL